MLFINALGKQKKKKKKNQWVKQKKKNQSAFLGESHIDILKQSQ